MNSWRIATETGLASDVHAKPMCDIDERTIRFVNVTRSALVLGSNQDVTSIPPELLEQFNAELVVRRSGGGAVFLAPSLQLWANISIPRGDKLFVDDLRKSFLPIGNIFKELLSKYSPGELCIHEGGLSGGSLAKTICFAGVGPGEITFEGAKILGISQRRSAQGSVFQCTVYSRYPHHPIAELFRDSTSIFPDPGYAFGVAEVFKDISEQQNSTIISQLTSDLEEIIHNF